LQGSPKFTQIQIFGLKINHLATPVSNVVFRKAKVFPSAKDGDAATAASAAGAGCAAVLQLRLPTNCSEQKFWNSFSNFCFHFQKRIFESSWDA
jgi:hypothetical protein